MAVNQTYAVSAGLIAVMAAAVGGWYAATSIVSSPDDLAGVAEPPTPSVITVAIERRALSTNLITRGTAQFGAPQHISLLPRSPGADVITTPPLEGSIIDIGSVALEVGGQPVTVLQGEEPMYRDMGPGDEGQDVLQLEENLELLGFSPGVVDGKYDELTSDAVAAWYRSSGYDSYVRAIDDLEKSRQAADDEILTKFADLDIARAELARVELAADHEAIRREAEVDSARNALQSNEASLAQYSSDDPLRTENDRIPMDGARKFADLSETLTDASQTYRDTLVRWFGPGISSADQALSPTDLAESWGATVDEIMDVSARQAASADDPNTPWNELTAFTWTHLSPISILKNCDHGSPGARCPSAEMSDGWEDVAAAKEALTETRNMLELLVDETSGILSLALQELDSSKASASSTILSVNARLLVAERMLHMEIEAKENIGYTIPASSLIFLPVLPARIGTVSVARGDILTGPIMSVTTPDLVINSSVSTVDLSLVSEGQSVSIEATEFSQSATGRISRVSSRPGTQGLDAQRVFVEIIPDDFFATLIDASVRVIIPVEATAGEVLVAPEVALWTGADGIPRISVLDGAGNVSHITVRTGLSAAGLVEIEALDGEFEEGQQVIVDDPQNVT